MPISTPKTPTTLPSTTIFLAIVKFKPPAELVYGAEKMIPSFAIASLYQPLTLAS